MSGPTRPPAAPDWARVGGADSKPTQVEREATGQPAAPQRRAETALTDRPESESGTVNTNARSLPAGALSSKLP